MSTFETKLRSILAYFTRKKVITNSAALVPTSGIATWTISNIDYIDLKNAVVSVREVTSDGNIEIRPYIMFTNDSIVLKFNTTATIAASTINVIILG